MSVGIVTNQFNKILTADGKETGLFANLLYNIRNQNFNGDEYGNVNYLNYVNNALQKGHYSAEICSKQDGANWFFQETGEKLGTIPLYNIRNQNFNGDEYGNANYLNYANYAWKSGHYSAEICAKQGGANWFFEVYKSFYSLQVSILNSELSDDKSLDTLLSSTSLGTQTVNNINGNSPLTESLDFSKSFSSSSSYTYSVDCEQSIDVKVKVSEGAIFEKAGVDVRVGLKFSETNSWTHSSSKTTELSLTESVTVEPGKCSKVAGYYKILQGNQVPFKSTALVSITGTIVDEHGNIVAGQTVANTEFIAQYINDNIKGMTVVDQNYSDTNVKVEITGYMSANLATMDSYTKEIACDGTQPDHSEL